jgi:hypothetical protein
MYSSLELATRLLYANSTVITDVNCLDIIIFVIWKVLDLHILKEYLKGSLD